MSEHAETIYEGRAPAALQRARRWTYWLDSRIGIGGFRVGLDGIVGLVPGIGDAITLLGGLVMLTSAHQLGLSNTVKAKIVGFTLIDFLAGSVPVIGDIFDFVYKSNRYSLKTIERAMARGETKPR